MRSLLDLKAAQPDKGPAIINGHSCLPPGTNYPAPSSLARMRARIASMRLCASVGADARWAARLALGGPSCALGVSVLVLFGAGLFKSVKPSCWLSSSSLFKFLLV